MVKNKGELALVIGSGRVGTHSITKLIKMQGTMINAEHEMAPVMPWYYNYDYYQARKIKLERRLKTYRMLHVDVALYNSAYIEQFIKDYPDIKVICLERDQEEFVASAVVTFTQYNFMQPKSDNCPKDWFNAFPTYCNKLSNWQCFEQYWWDYKLRTDNLIKKYPKHIKKYYTKDLNNYDKVKEMLKFIGIEQPKIITNIKEHKMGVWNG